MRETDDELVRTQVWFSRTEMLVINSTFVDGTIKNLPSMRRMKLFINRAVRAALEEMTKLKQREIDEYKPRKPQWLVDHEEKTRQEGVAKRKATINNRKVECNARL